MNFNGLIGNFIDDVVNLSINLSIKVIAGNATKFYYESVA